MISAGPKGGLLFSNVKGGLRDDLNAMKMGFYAGGFLRVPVAGELSIQAEGLFTNRGYKFSSALGGYDSALTNNITYVDFPFLLNYSIGSMAFAEAGTQIGYLVNSRLRGSVMMGAVPKEVDTSSIYGFNTTEYSVIIGGGVNLPYNLSIALRFTYGLTKLRTADFSHNMGFSANLFYSFGAGNGNAGYGRGGVYKTF